MIRFREYLGKFDDSVRTELVFRDEQELISHLRNLFDGYPVEREDVILHFCGQDHLTGTEIYLMAIRNLGVVGFCTEAIPFANQ